MSVDLLVQSLLNAVGLAMVYVLVALGLTLIFSILGIINFAHGEFYMVGGFVAYYVFAVFELSYVVAVALAVVGVGVLGMAVERCVFRPLRHRMLNAFIASLGLLWVLQAVAQLAFGVQDKSVPSAFPGIARFFGVVVSTERLVVTLAAVVIVAGLYLFLRFSRYGQALRAVAQDADAAALQGVNIEMISAVGFGIGCALAGGAGALLAPVFAVSPTMGHLPVIKAFVVVILGGMGSLPGAVLGGLLLGAVEGLGALFLSSAAVSMLGFLLVIAILLVRPRGLFGVG